MTVRSPVRTENCLAHRVTGLLNGSARQRNIRVASAMLGNSELSNDKTLGSLAVSSCSTNHTPASKQCVS